MNRSINDRMREITELTQRISRLCAEIAEEQTSRAYCRESSTFQSSWVRSLLQNRAKLRSAFDQGVFADPAFELLLDLFASEEEGKPVSVSDACCTSGVPQTTALRWISLLASRGLVQRRSDPHDRRRVFLELTEEASAMIGAWVKAAAVPGTAPA